MKAKKLSLLLHTALDRFCVVASPLCGLCHFCVHGMQRSRAWCGTPPILGVVNMVGTRNFTCYMGAL